MENYEEKPAYYDLPLYMRIFPVFRNDEYIKSHKKRDAFDDYLTLYSAFVAFGFIRPNNWWQGGYN